MLLRFARSLTVLSGPCTSTGRCVQSPNYPNSYGADESCDIVAPLRPLYTTQFDLAWRSALTVGGVSYYGATGPPQGIVSTSITWSSSWTTATGWQICLRITQTLGLKHGIKLILSRFADLPVLGQSGM